MREPSSVVSSPFVYVNNAKYPIDPHTLRPKLGPNIFILNEKGTPVLGPLKPGERFKMVGMWEKPGLDEGTKKAMKLEWERWIEKEKKKTISSGGEKCLWDTLCFSTGVSLK